MIKKGSVLEGEGDKDKAGGGMTATDLLDMLKAPVDAKADLAQSGVVDDEVSWAGRWAFLNMALGRRHDCLQVQSGSTPAHLWYAVLLSVCQCASLWLPAFNLSTECIIRADAGKAARPHASTGRKEAALPCHWQGLSVCAAGEPVVC